MKVVVDKKNRAFTDKKMLRGVSWWGCLTVRHYTQKCGQLTFVGIKYRSEILKLFRCNEYLIISPPMKLIKIKEIVDSIETITDYEEIRELINKLWVRF